MADKLRITINFKHTKEEENLYNKLNEFSSPGSFIKDVLFGRISMFSLDGEEENKKENLKKEAIKDDEIMSILG